MPAELTPGHHDEGDDRNRYAVVEPGVVNLWLTNHIKQQGWHFAPDPSSQGACTIGGNVATNSGGPHTLKYGVTVNHVLGVEMVLSVSQAQATHVPYKGASEIVNAVLGQQVTFGAPITAVAYSNIVAGKLRPLAVTGPARNPKLPTVPTLAEAGLPGVELTSWGGVSVPTGTPDAIVSRVRSAFEAALRQPAVVAALEEQGGMVHPQDSETFTRAFGREIGFTEAMMKRIKLEPM